MCRDLSLTKAFYSTTRDLLQLSYRQLPTKPLDRKVFCLGQTNMVMIAQSKNSQIVGNVILVKGTIALLQRQTQLCRVQLDKGNTHLHHHSAEKMSDTFILQPDT